MKNKGLKVTLVIGIIILLSIISFCGLYVKGIYRYEDIVPEYLLGDGVTGHRTIVLVPEKVAAEAVDVTSEEVPEGELMASVEQTTSSEAAAAEEEEETGNTQEMMTEENYQKAKEIVENRLANISSQAYYTIKLDKETGKIHVNVLDNSYTDTISSILAQKGIFKIVDTETNEVLLDNTHVKETSAKYTSGTTGVISFLNIEFTEEGKEKLKEITNTYVASTDEEGNETGKTVTMKIDDTDVLQTSFEEEITTGSLQLTVGTETTDNAELQENLIEASNMAVIIKSEAMPLTYIVDENVYTGLSLTTQDIQIMLIVLGVVIIVLAIYLIARFRKNGLIGIITLFGILAALLLVLRYANVIITAEAIIGIILSMMIAYLAKIIILKDMKKEDTETEIKIKFLEGMKTVGKIVLPIIILSIVLCFVNWLPVYSFAMALFWGFVVTAIIEFAVMRTLLLGTKKEKQ